MIVPALALLHGPGREAAGNGPWRPLSPGSWPGGESAGAATARPGFPRRSAAQIEEALAKGISQGARQLVPKFLAAPQVSADALLRTGVDLAQHELFPEAAGVFGRCVEEHPALFEGYYNLALAELALRQYPAALATLQKAPHATPSETVARTYLRGKIELALGQNAPAEQDLATAFAADPQEENYALDLGLAYLRVRKYQPAVEVFEKAGPSRRIPPSSSSAWGWRNTWEGRTPKPLLSVTACFVLTISPPCVPCWLASTMQGNAAEPAQAPRRVLRDPAPFPYLYYIHAAALLKQQSQDYGLILQDLARAEQSIPACSLCYLAQSKAHQKMGQREAATADLDKSVELDPTLAEAWYRLATLDDQAGRHAEAQQARRRFEELKENKADRDTELLRDVFMKALSGEGAP